MVLLGEEVFKQPDRMTVKEYRETLMSKTSEKVKSPKYKNIVTYINGIKFDSIKESERYLELLILLRCKKITDLKCHVAFELAPKELLAGETRAKSAMKYICDFHYYDVEKKKMIIEDVKSPSTKNNPVYRNKKHLMKSLLGLDIIEI